MDNRSLLEIMKEERDICDALQNVENILNGVMGAVREGLTDGEARQEMVRKAESDRKELKEALRVRRMAMGLRFSECLVLARREIQKAEQPRDAGGNGGGGEACTDPMQEGLSHE